MRRLFVLLAVLGCGGSEPSVPAAAAPAPEPTFEAVATCDVPGVVTVAGVPRAALEVGMRASAPSGERSFRGVAEASTATAPDGSFSVAAPCGTRIHLMFPGWIWANEPPEVTAEAAPGSLDVVLVPERSARIRVVDDAGEPVVAELRRPGGEVVPIPATGADVVGLPYGGVAGTLVAPGLPERTWRMNRSDVLAEVEPRSFDATVRLGIDAPLWVTVPDPRDVAGIWCLDGTARGAPCKLRDSSWFCECGALDRVGIATTLWEVGLARDVVGKDLVLEAWPNVVTQCLHVGDEGVANVRPAGVHDRLLLGTTGPASKLCLTLPEGEPLEVVQDDRVIPHVATEAGDVDLR